ncbi:hypothetical protein IFM89_009856 [Coptis chinensis]|uniref:EDRF1 N-terminal domain-containing protein n=1 Tax=Coptis chinensis TaxID=261450 RepID=A0A835HYI9_9MAGN|nr:hypothetical protein IFM89_009856 [Coptis chinensis]
METKSGGGELLECCIGRLEIARPKPVGFLCGSIPVPTDKAFYHHNNNAFTSSSSALIPSSSQSNKLNAPRYRVLPTETDLNTPPDLPHQILLPINATTSTTGDFHRESTAISQNFARKCEALAVSGLAEYGDEIDVVAPADILKQIFKMPYTKARLSIAVHRIGQTLVLNSGPDIEEGEKLVRRHSSQSKSADPSLFLNFAMHSVRAEACDCPPSPYATPEEESNSTILPGQYHSTEDSLLSTDNPENQETSPFLRQRGDGARRNDGLNNHAEYPQVDSDKYWNSKRKNRNKRHDAVKKTSLIGEKARCPIQESEKYRRISNDGFLRILFWQFHNFRMLLGSDLLLFSNEKYVAVSLHLWDVTRQVTPLTWLEAWLDNIMASVPELAICYHENGVVQGYELLKTDDIFLLKGISEDGTPAFHPQVVQQNGHSVLRFLQNNCKQDPGAYWLYKNAGEDVIQLFDLSVIPKSHSSEDHDGSSSPLPSLMHRGRRDSLFSLGTLLFRLAHRLSLSLVPNSKAKCARLFKKCFDFLDEQEHLVVRALAHEQFARLILRCYEEMDLAFEYIPLESEVRVTDAKDESPDSSKGISGSNLHGTATSQVVEDSSSEKGAEILPEPSSGYASANNTPKTCTSTPKTFLESKGVELEDSEGSLVSPSGDDISEVFQMSEPAPQLVQTVSDPISTKLAAVHHVSQAIKSLRWRRQLQSSEEELVDHGKRTQERSSTIHLSVCACGDTDCIEVCDIREWLPRSKMDHKLWKLVLLLGESYLALGEAYLVDGQLHQALKVVDLACSVYGSMPQHLENAQFISSMISCSTFTSKLHDRNRSTGFLDDMTELSLTSSEDSVDRFSSTHLFWAKVWTLVGDVYIEHQITTSTETSVQLERKVSSSELRISTEVEKEDEHPNLGVGDVNGSDSAYLNKRDANTQSSIVDKMYTVERITLDTNHRRHDGTSEMHESAMSTKSDDGTKEVSNGRIGGIFKFLKGPIAGDADYNLSAALSCYNAARKALAGLQTGSSELQSVFKKKGWVCNEFGRIWLQRKDIERAELAFADAVKAFKEVSDHANIILINCNLGHGRRALAEEMGSKLEQLKVHKVLQGAYNRALETAKLEYSESLRYYAAARSELSIVDKVAGSVTVSSSLRNEVYTQLAHTYLRLGMLLAREDISAEVYENGPLEDLSMGYINPCDRRARKELRKHEISANDAIREALSLYELLGELRKQEAAYAYFQLACYHRNSCLKFLYQIKVSRKENNILQKVKQYAALAERSWQKSVDFYGPMTHPAMHLTILIERSALSWKLSDRIHSNTMLESALLRLLEARHLSVEPTINSLGNDHTEIDANFKSQLQAILKRMLQVALSGNASKSFGVNQASSACNKPGDIAKLRELYGMSLKLTDFSLLHDMYELWMS